MVSFEDSLRTETAKLKRLSPREKAVYIWQYYKLWIIGITCALALMIYLPMRIANNIPDCWLYVIFANTREPAGNGSALWEDYADYAGLDLTQKRLEFNGEAYFDYLKNQARGNRYYEAFVALADAGVLDAITMESASLSALGQSGRLLDLNSPLCGTIRSRWGDRLVWYQPCDGSAPIPVGIDLSDSLLVTRYSLYAESCALGVAVESQNIPELERFLAFLLEDTDHHA